jgi:UvrD-like helicase family protein
MTARTPTPEQQQAIDLFTTGKDLVTEAGAGTGKTTTLGMMARATPRHGGYLAFNKAIALDAQRAMPHTVDCRTVHSVAWRAVSQGHPHGRALLDRTYHPRVAPWKAAKHLGLGVLVIQIPTPTGALRTRVMQPAWQAGHVMRALTVFCNSADDVPAAHHFPYVEGIDPPADGGRRTYVNNRQLARELLPALERAWADMQSPTGALRFTHDVYVKLWQLGRYRMPVDYILFDEAQDASPVMLAALANQIDAQVVYVGDSQQQIYDWRGAINAMDRVADTVPRTFLTQSWRFGPPVADVANAILNRLDAALRLTGTTTVPSVVYDRGGAPTPRAVLCRTNAAAVEAVFSYQERGMAPHLVGGVEDIVRFAEAAIRLQAGEQVSHPDLACFDNWRQVQDYVSEDPGGSDLRVMVKMLDDYGPQIVMDALTGLIGEDGADVIISTAHRAKGREWDRVRLGPDFELPEDAPHAELRLLYVAATRATHHLDITACEPIRSLLAGIDR